MIFRRLQYFIILLYVFGFGEIFSQSTFMSSSLIHMPTTKPVDGQNLDIRINHRFGDAKSASKDFLGLDNGANVQLSAEYGFTDKFSAGILRTSDLKTYESKAKYALFSQENNFPVSISLFGVAGVTTSQKEVRLGGLFNNPPVTTGIPYIDSYISSYSLDKDLSLTDRTSYLGSVLISRRFGEFFSLQVSPMLLHRNFVKPHLSNNRLGVSVGGRIKLTKRLDLTFESILSKHRDYVSDDYDTADNTSYGGLKSLTAEQINMRQSNDANVRFDNPQGLTYAYIRNVYFDQSVKYYTVPFSLGLDIEAGGHVFQLFVSNNRTMAYTQLLQGANYDYKKGDFNIGFNLSRIFSFEDESKWK